MVSFFREKSAASIIWLILLFALLHAQFIFYPPSILIEPEKGLLNNVLQSFHPLHPSFITALYAVLIITQALRLNYILNEERMFTKAAFTTAMSYIILTALYPPWENISAALITNTFIIWLLSRILKMYNPAAAAGFIFNTAFIAGMIVLLYYPAFSLIILLFSAIGILRAFRLKEWLVVLLGMISPFYILFAIIFLSGEWKNATHFLPKFYPHLLNGENRKLLLLCSAGTGFLLVSGIIILQQSLPRMIIQVRKNWTVILLMLLFFIPSIFLIKAGGFNNLVIAAVPASAFISCAFSGTKKIFFSAVLFWVAFTLVIYNNWFIK